MIASSPTISGRSTFIAAAIGSSPSEYPMEIPRAYGLMSTSPSDAVSSRASVEMLIQRIDMEEQARCDFHIHSELRHRSDGRLQCERIHQTLGDAEFNISEAARRLGILRRTLGRKFQKQ